MMLPIVDTFSTLMIFNHAHDRVIISGFLSEFLTAVTALSPEYSCHPANDAYIQDVASTTDELTGTYHPVLCASSIFCQKKDFSHISDKYSLFLANNIVIAINY